MMPGAICAIAVLRAGYFFPYFRTNGVNEIKKGQAIDAGARVQIQPSLATIREAQKFLAKYFAPTRLIAAPFLSQRTARHVYLKLETELPTGSFKLRGALHALAQRMKNESVREVVASSTGNHGAAVAFAAKKFGIAAKIFLPMNCNPVKRGRVAALGAAIVESGGGELSSAFQLAAEYAKQPGVYFLNDATDLDLPAGPATIACEILEQLPQTSAIVVPMGDTALIRGIAATAKQMAPQVRIVGVQAERAPAYYLSWKEGKAVGTETCDTIADGLATRTPEAANVRELRKLVDDIVLVSEEQMLRAIEALLVDEHVVAEPAGAASTAALLQSSEGWGNFPVLVVSGANVSREVLNRAFQVGS
jgi:threonine dehydratase